MVLDWPNRLGPRGTKWHLTSIAMREQQLRWKALWLIPRGSRVRFPSVRASRWRVTPPFVRGVSCVQFLPRCGRAGTQEYPWRVVAGLAARLRSTVRPDAAHPNEIGRRSHVPYLDRASGAIHDPDAQGRSEGAAGRLACVGSSSQELDWSA